MEHIQFEWDTEKNEINGIQPITELAGCRAAPCEQ